jgi:hypothetical protein
LATVSQPAARFAATFVQQVTGDFDGDSRPDRLEIAGDVSVAMRLSRSTQPEQLSLASAPGTFDRILGLIGIDVDHDGDLDLVAALSGGGFAVWINSGNGHFEQARPRAPDSAALTSATLLLGSLPISPAGATTRTSSHPSRPLTTFASLNPLDTVALFDSSAIRLIAGGTNSGRAPPSSRS